MTSIVNLLKVDSSDESVVCIDSDSSASVIYVKSSCAPHNKSFNDRLDQLRSNSISNQSNGCAIQRPAESYSSSEDEIQTLDLNGIEIQRRLFVAMDSIALMSDLERSKRFWNSNVVKDFKEYLHSLDGRLRRFVKDPFKSDMIILNDIPKKLWIFIIDQCAFYGIHVQSRGSNNDEYLVSNRTPETYIPQGWQRRLDSVIFKKINNTWKSFLGKKRDSIDLDPVTSKGYQMLIKMGWQPGTALGKRKDGLLEPISLNNGRFSKSGLGIADYF